MAEIVTVGGSAAMCTPSGLKFEPAVRKAGRKGRLSRPVLSYPRKKPNKDQYPPSERRKGQKLWKTSGTVVAGGMGIGDREDLNCLMSWPDCSGYNGGTSLRRRAAYYTP